MKCVRAATAGAIGTIVGPEQAGVGVSAGVQTVIIGTQLGVNLAQSQDEGHVVVAVDLKNAHNAFDRKTANEQAQLLARTDPSLEIFAIAFDAITAVQPDIYMRSSETSNGFQFLCKSESGGGQGNGLTCNGFVITINGALKKVSEKYPNIRVKAIHDDITLSGPHKEMFGSEDDPGALALLLTEVEKIHLEPNLLKFQAYATNEATRALIPSWLKQPSLEVADEITGQTIKVYGVSICGAAIGDRLYVRTVTVQAIDEICDRIENTASAVAALDSHAAFAVTSSSLKARADFLLSIHPTQILTVPGTEKLNAALNKAFALSLGFDPLKPDPAEISPGLDPLFTRDLLRLKPSLGGAGLRSKDDQALLLNTFACIGPQLLDRKDDKGRIFPGLCNWLEPVFGKGAFDTANLSTRWKFFLENDGWYAPDMTVTYSALQQEFQNRISANGLQDDPQHAPSASLSSPSARADPNSTKTFSELWKPFEHKIWKSAPTPCQKTTREETRSSRGQQTISAPKSSLA